MCLQPITQAVRRQHLVVSDGAQYTNLPLDGAAASEKEMLSLPANAQTIYWAYGRKSHRSGFIYSMTFAPLPSQYLWKGEQGINSRYSAIYIYNPALLIVTLPDKAVIPHWHL